MAGTVPPAAACRIDDRLLPARLHPPVPATHRGNDLVSSNPTPSRRRKGRRIDARHRRATQRCSTARRSSSPATRDGIRGLRHRLGPQPPDGLDEHSGSSSNSPGRAAWTCASSTPARPRLGRRAPTRPRPSTLPRVMTRPSLRLRYPPGHTARLQHLPFSVQGSFGHRGTYVGLDPSPVESSAAGPFGPTPPDSSPTPTAGSSANPATGKSALVKCLLWRQAAIYGTGPGDGGPIADPKGSTPPSPNTSGSLS